MANAPSPRFVSLGVARAPFSRSARDDFRARHMKARLVGSLLWLYERASRRGLLDNPLARRVFESAYLAYKLLIEAGPVARLQSVVVPGSTVIDVGAGIGFFSLRFARWVGAGGHVIAIEPESRNIASLRRRVRRAGLQRVVDCVQAAASDRTGEARLAVNPTHPGGHHIADDGEPVPAVTLDELTDADPRNVSLIKIDVQGAELRVLTGAKSVIETHRPAIFIEVDDSGLERFGTSAREVIETLDGLGYVGHTLARHGIRAAEGREELIRQSADTYLDILFLARPRSQASAR